jgi:hypothetical protein
MPAGLAEAALAWAVADLAEGWEPWPAPVASEEECRTWVVDSVAADLEGEDLNAVDWEAEVDSVVADLAAEDSEVEDLSVEGSVVGADSVAEVDSKLRRLPARRWKRVPEAGSVRAARSTVHSEEILVGIAQARAS